VNEALSRALLRARLSDEDVAARLQVDPKTVRRWLEGRVPYLRHRWALALLVGVDESDLWPQLSSARSRSGEVVAVYAHRDWVSSQMWLRLFSSAGREAGVLADSGFLLAGDSAIPKTLAERARAGVRVRVCLPDPTPRAAASHGAGPSAGRLRVAGIRDALRPAELRLHRVRSYYSICYSDQELLVAQHVYGVADGQSPMLHLRGDADQEMISAYLASFEQVWNSARPSD
jgi:transcriptional regulator with XRE-family HTH domain